MNGTITILWSSLLTLLMATSLLSQSEQGVRLLHLHQGLDTADMTIRQISPAIPLWRDVAPMGASQLRREIPPSNYEFIVRRNGTETEYLRRSFTVRADRYYTVTLADSAGTQRDYILEWQVKNIPFTDVETRIFFATAGSRRLAIAFGGNIFFSEVLPFQINNHASISAANFSSMTIYDANTYEELATVDPAIEPGNAYTFIVSGEGNNWQVRKLVESSADRQVPLALLTQPQGNAVRFVNTFDHLGEVEWLNNGAPVASTPSLSASNEMEELVSGNVINARTMLGEATFFDPAMQGTGVFFLTQQDEGARPDIAFIPTEPPTNMENEVPFYCANAGAGVLQVRIAGQEVALAPGEYRRVVIAPENAEMEVDFENAPSQNYRLDAVEGSYKIYFFAENGGRRLASVLNLLDNTRQSPMARLPEAISQNSSVTFVNTLPFTITLTVGREKIDLFRAGMWFLDRVEVGTPTIVTFPDRSEYRIQYPIEPGEHSLVLLNENNVREIFIREAISTDIRQFPSSEIFVRVHVPQDVQPPLFTFFSGDQPDELYELQGRPGEFSEFIRLPYERFSQFNGFVRFEDAVTDFTECMVQFDEPALYTISYFGTPGTAGEWFFVPEGGGVIREVPALCYVLSVPEPFAEAVTLAPNPVSSEVRVRYEMLQAGSVTFTVSDMLGREVLRRTEVVSAGVQTAMLPVAHLAGGVYIIQMSHRQKTMSRRFIKTP